MLRYGLMVALVLFASLVIPDVSSLFDNVALRVVFILGIIYVLQHDVTLGVLLAICYVVSVSSLREEKIIGWIR